MWDDRYSEEGFAYGLAPNDFLASQVGLLRSPVLSLCSGEGRNEVWLAQQGLEVHSLDASAVGVRKTLALAQERGVTVHAQVGDLAGFALGEARWGGVVAIFAHLPQPLRAQVHAGIVRALRPGGVLLLEAYTPRQLKHRTGGPQAAPMLYEPEDLAAELRGLTLERCAEVERDVVEGRYHTGRAAVVQVIGRRPADPR